MIALKGSAKAASTTVTLPAHAPGDYIFIVSVRGASATAPTLGSGFTDLDSGSTTAGAYTASYRMGWLKATTSSHTSGTWTNASYLWAFVMSGIGADYITAGHNEDIVGASTTKTLGALTLNEPAVAFVMALGVDYEGAAPGLDLLAVPSGMTALYSESVANHNVILFLTDSAVSSFSTQSMTGGSSSNPTFTNTFELIPAPDSALFWAFP